jgi:hypothetical protein
MKAGLPGIPKASEIRIKAPAAMRTICQEVIEKSPSG